MTSRERVQRCLRFQTPDRPPRNLWALPWFTKRYPAEFQALTARFPGDFGGTPRIGRPSPRVSGDAYAAGRYCDEWGCVFENIQDGVIGEIKRPLVSELAQWREAVHPPCETLPEDAATARDTVNRACAGSPAFVPGGCCARPWERFQFLRGTVNAMMDVMDPDDPDLRGILNAIHGFYLKELEFWAHTDVDALSFMDDWGAQSQLLIPPPIWRELFKPFYKDYCDLAHSCGKFIFMHSDGHIAAVYPDLIEIGVDAINSQLFCMDMAKLAHYRGRITFWGEIDRQHVLPSPDPAAGRRAVWQVAEQLYDPSGGIIAQFEAGPGTNPAVATAIFEAWDEVARTWPENRAARQVQTDGIREKQ